MQEHTDREAAELVAHTGQSNHERMLRLPDVLSAVGMSRSWLYGAMAHGDFPRPLRLGKRAIGWREADIIAWQGGLYSRR